jgi:hypothetical protein
VEKSGSACAPIPSSARELSNSSEKGSVQEREKEKEKERESYYAVDPEDLLPVDRSKLLTGILIADKSFSVVGTAISKSDIDSVDRICWTAEHMLLLQR